MRKVPFIVAVAAVAVLLAACRAEVNVTLQVEEDGSGVMAFELGLDEEFRELMASQGADPDELFGDLETDLEEGTVTSREDGDMAYQGVELEFDDVSEVEGFLTDASSDFFGGFGAFSFDMDESSATFDATLTAEEQDLGEDLPFDPSQFTGDFFSASFLLSMPGSVTAHNADEVLADGRLRWDLPLLGGTTELHAESEFGGSDFPWLFVIIGLVVVLGLAAMVGAIAMSKQREKQAVTAAAVALQEDPAAAESEPPETAPDLSDEE
jgi:hypothetical protein